MPGADLDHVEIASISPKGSSGAAALRRRHDGRNHLLVLENGEFTYLSVPPLPSESIADEAKLCFLSHRRQSWDPLSEKCCLREAGHVHAHVHHGDIIQDVLLEQCLDEAGCTLPIPSDLGSILNPISDLGSVLIPNSDGDHHGSDHEHQEGCGHNQIAHGDHYDWLIPMKDGSYVLSHVQATSNGGSQFIEHGRLVKVGESLGQLKRRPKQVVDLFTYEGPRRKGHESIPTSEGVPRVVDTDTIAVIKSPSNIALSSPKQAVIKDDLKLTIPRVLESEWMTKTTFDVMGICCPSEVPLIKRMLEPLPGVDEVVVNPTVKTVTVLHDSAITTDVQIVKILNEARLDASIHQRGKQRKSNNWPSPWTIGSGVLLAVSFLRYAWSPLKWVALGSVAVGLPPILVRTFVALRRCVMDINALMLIAVGGSIALGDYEEAGSIAFLFTLADWLESRSSDKARDAISSVADLAPQTAVLMDGQRVVVEDVSMGTLLAVKAGELIPIDGEVVSGRSTVDESNVTGESRPIEKTIGAVVCAGTMNLSGYITVKTTALAEDSAVARMVRLVEEAQNQHSRTELLVEKVAKYYTPFVVVSAILVATIPFAAGSRDHKHWIYLALVLLVVACPCALVISTPVATTCGIAQAARAGLLVRGGSHLEALGKVKVVAMDKTGTLTEGHFRVLDVHPVDDTFHLHDILYWVASVERKSSHPLAPALIAFARLQGVEPTGDVTDFDIIPGSGVSALIDGSKVQIGNARLAANLIGFEGFKLDNVNTWSDQGATVGWVGVDDRLVGVFAVADSQRAEAREAIARLKRLGMQVVMLTGDSAAAAAAIQRQIGDIEVHAELLPEDKVKLVKKLRTIGMTAMVGDGINDAPALALADVGIAMGVAGSAVAMETADVALMTNDLRKLAVAIKLGQNVRRKILQNVSLSLLTKITIIVLAAAGYPSLWAAVLADVGTCLVVIFNSMRLLNRQKGVVLPKFESKNKHEHKHTKHNHHDCQDDLDHDSCNHHDHQEELGKSGHNHHNHHDDHHDDHHEELGKVGHNYHNHHHHHEELGKIGDNHHNHHHSHEELNKSGHNHHSHHNHHDELGKIVHIECNHHDHHEELGKVGDNHQNHQSEFDKVDHHDHHVQSGGHHHHHGLRIPCWPHHQQHFPGTKGADENDMSCSEQLLLGQAPKGWSKFKQKILFLSGNTSKSRKCCIKAGLESNSCSGTGESADSSVGCSEICCSKNKRNAIKSASGTIASNCCTELGSEKGCCSNGRDPLDNCCRGPSQENKSSLRVNQKGHSSSVTARGSRQCCSGPNLEKNCSSSSATDPGGSQCLSGPDMEKKCCSKSGTKLEAAPRELDEQLNLHHQGHQHDQGRKHEPGSIPSAPLYLEICGRDAACLSSDRHGERENNSCHLAANCSRGTSPNMTGEKDGLLSGDRDLVKPHGKAAALENHIGCGLPRCSAEHSNCGTEALADSPLRDLTSFTLPVSPLNV